MILMLFGVFSRNEERIEEKWCPGPIVDICFLPSFPSWRSLLDMIRFVGETTGSVHMDVNMNESMMPERTNVLRCDGT